VKTPDTPDVDSVKVWSGALSSLVKTSEPVLKQI
jgi:hypothetical protein